MTQGLERRYGQGHYHFVTFSCAQRAAHFHSEDARRLFEHCLEAVRQRYQFTIDAYVVMPEHVHLLLSEPAMKDLSVVLQALKISVARKMTQRPFWQRRFYDFNVFTDKKRLEKRRYIHRNPFARGLVAHPKDWVGSSYRQWAYGETGIVRVETTWTCASAAGAQASCEPTSHKTRCGAPTAEVSYQAKEESLR
jgi:putative transposase